MIDVGFERINPTPHYPSGFSTKVLATYGWESRALVVKKFKQAIKKDLRTAQIGKCCYCRRSLFDDGATHIEHFIEKSHYPQFTFEISNLALSCGICNGFKNGHNLALSSLRKLRARRQKKDVILRCPALSAYLAHGSPLPTNAIDYRWVHPHFDNYSQNIRIDKGWVFVGVTRKGFRTIQKINLNALAQIERRALQERMATRGGRLSLLVGAMAELDRHRASEVAEAVIKALRRRRKTRAD